ncbi:hypothetical protein [Oxynema aestuarii]|uniref:Uncharacterized protein n=1 Tax=Oxynema aestuarii AP17 TaxID=2064643 RepID=A0A6H1TRG3_9CYAN|nr:hypothetical protein [Oxynema aestuarii]QIZ69188.1 hypothetical protein HCG48_00120 [Oxynema aestuarii AP17]
MGRRSLLDSPIILESLDRGRIAVEGRQLGQSAIAQALEFKIARYFSEMASQAICRPCFYLEFYLKKDGNRLFFQVDLDCSASR